MDQDAVFAGMAVEPAWEFAREHFGGADLKHQKRNAALLRTAACIFRHPGGTLPHKMGHPNRYKAMDLLMNRREVTHASILAPHLARTQKLMAAHAGPLLVLHDTTTLDYSGLTKADLGPVGDGNGRGYLCHNSLVVDPSNREVLGLAQQILHRREPVPPGEGVEAKRDRESRESRVWSNAVETLGSAAPGPKVIDVGDRGADIFEFLATEKRLGRSCLVRATYNRNITVGHAEHGATAKLFDHLRAQPSLANRSKKVFDTAREKQRTAELSVAYAAVQLRPPHVCKGIYEEVPIAAWCVRIWEENPPAQANALEWFLISLEPVTTTAQAWTMSSYYESRFVIEEYHKAQKTGCQIEDLQFETVHALQPMIALLSVVATVLLNLRQACRREDADTRLASEVIAPIYEEIMRAHRYKQPRGPLTIKEFYLAVGRLGGHMNRRSDGHPGWLTLWRGWTDLQKMVTGAEAERRRQKNAG